jgi:hypothetical protein
LQQHSQPPQPSIVSQAVMAAGKTALISRCDIEVYEADRGDTSSGSDVELESLVHSRRMKKTSRSKASPRNYSTSTTLSNAVRSIWQVSAPFNPFFLSQRLCHVTGKIRQSEQQKVPSEKVLYVICQTGKNIVLKRKIF